MRLLLCVAAAALLLACPVTSGPSCEARCITAGYCCTGNSSGCQHPSCQMGCVFGAGSPTVASCNATCLAAKGCSFTFQGQTFQMCGDCSQRWLDPTTLTPVVLPGAQPFWPPGWDLGSCGSCDTEQCQVGCALAFDPGLNPSPPASPTPLPPKPYPPPPFPNAGPGFNISAVFGSSMVLQRAPAAAAIFGVTGSSGSSGAVKVTVTPGAGGGAPYTVAATVSSGRWKALLHPAADDGVDYTIAAACDAGSGCSGSMQLTGVRFGDVYYCAGQSNMWLQMRYTYALNASRTAIAAGQLDNIRLMSGDSQTQGLAGGAPPLHPWRTLADAASLPPEDPDSWAQFSATCFHFAEALTERFKAAGQAPPTLGLVATAIGGSTIEEWMTNAEAEKCFGFQGSANGAQLNHVLWDANVAPFLDMTVKGWLFYVRGAHWRGWRSWQCTRPFPLCSRTRAPPHTLTSSHTTSKERTMLAACMATAHSGLGTPASCPPSLQPGALPGLLCLAPQTPWRPFSWPRSPLATARALGTLPPSAGRRGPPMAWPPTQPCPTRTGRTATTWLTPG